jgi:hypothetical protein
VIPLVAAITLTVDPPARPGVETVLTLVGDDGKPVVGATLSVVQRPGLPTEKEAGAGITDSLGKVRWKPELAGPALLYAGDEAVGSFHVGWPTPPPSTLVPLVVLVVAALATIAAGYGSWRRSRA